MRVIFLSSYLKLSPSNRASDGSSPLARNESWKNVLLNGKKYEENQHNAPMGRFMLVLIQFLDPDKVNHLKIKKIKLNTDANTDVYIGGLNTLFYIFFMQDFGTRFCTIRICFSAGTF